jgi:hypothetical protein
MKKVLRLATDRDIELRNQNKARGSDQKPGHSPPVETGYEDKPSGNAG